MSYGWCRCGAKIKSRTRGIPSMDTCEAGHTNDARMTLAYDPFDASLKQNSLLGDLQFVEAPEGPLKYEPKTLLFISKDMADKFKKMMGDEGDFTFKLNHTELPGKFVTPEPLPTPYENELLDCLIEECAEVIQRATKMKRFGVDEIQPGQGFTNAERLSHEFGDLVAVYQRCTDAELMNPDYVETQIPIKHAKLDEFLQHSSEEEAA